MMRFLLFLKVMPLWAWGLLSVAFYAVSADRIAQGTYTPMTFAVDLMWAACMWLIWRERT